jgi:gelsolin
MPSHDSLAHLKVKDWRDSNVRLICSDIDHKVKYNSAVTEPAWQGLGEALDLYIWRIEDFQVVAWLKNRCDDFHEGASYIVLYLYRVGCKYGEEKLSPDIFFWLGWKTTQDEAGTAAYKMVELEECLEQSRDTASGTPERRVRRVCGSVSTHSDPGWRRADGFHTRRDGRKS